MKTIKTLLVGKSLNNDELNKTTGGANTNPICQISLNVNSKLFCICDWPSANTPGLCGTGAIELDSIPACILNVTCLPPNVVATCEAPPR